jgi:uncharacterized membrane protein
MRFIAWTLLVWVPVALFASVASGNDVLTGFAVVFAFPIYTVGVLAMFRRSGRGG